MARTLGVLGGTFNPPHSGHLALARAAADELGLERVLVIPARAAPHKPTAADPGVEHRLRMCELLAGEDPRLAVCEVELERPAPSYTADTLRHIHAREPSAELTLILGADMARTLPSWREPEEIARAATLAVAARDGVERTGVEAALEDLDGAGVTPRARFLAMAPVATSSTDVRARVATGQPIDGLVPAPVAEYVATHGLYREGPR